MPRLGFEEAWARRVEFKDGEARYGPREWSPNIIRRLEDATDLSILAPGFPAAMIDDEPEETGKRSIRRYSRDGSMRWKATWAGCEILVRRRNRTTSRDELDDLVQFRT